MDNPYNGRISQSDIYAGLERNGILLISPGLVKMENEIGVEDLITEILEKSVEIREAETLPALMAYRPWDKYLLMLRALEKDVGSKVGYLAEKTDQLKGIGPNSKALQEISDYLRETKTEEERPLIGGYVSRLRDMFEARDELEKKWLIFDPVHDEDYIEHLNKAFKGTNIL
ncbi:MAG: hypothetical protein GXP63_02465 [DPANN group archaeon]|nr:hypothetical protein [DPANN group archaeon]